MGVRTWAAACAAAMVCAWASDAGATVYTLTAEGTVAAGTVYDSGPDYLGTDGDGLFGPAGGSLIGDTFTAIVTIDSSIGDVNAHDGSLLIEGWGSGPSPVTSAELTINGRTQDFTNGSYPWFDAWNLYYKISGGWVGYQFFVGTGSEPFLNISYSTGEYVYDVGAFHSADGATSGKLITTFASMSPEIQAELSVPEPATWALMVLGLAMVGAVARSTTGSRQPRGAHTATPTGTVV